MRRKTLRPWGFRDRRAHRCSAIPGAVSFFHVGNTGSNPVGDANEIAVTTTLIALSREKSQDLALVCGRKYLIAPVRISRSFLVLAHLTKKNAVKSSLKCH